MTQIKKLSPQQVEKFQKYIDKWNAVAMSTEKADRDRAHKAILKMYEQAGVSDPKRIHWCSSPQQLLAVAKEEMSNGQGRVEEFRKLKRDAVRVIPDFMCSRYYDGRLRSGIISAVANGVRARIVASSIRRTMRAYLLRLPGNGRMLSNVLYGQQDAGWLGFYDFLARELNLAEDLNPLLSGWMELAQSAGWMIPTSTVCYVVERPSVLKMQLEGNVVNCEDGPAIVFGHVPPKVKVIDDYKMWGWKGVGVEKDVVERPRFVTVARILKERNMETRRVMMERMGYDRFLKRADAQVEDRDRYGTLYRAVLRVPMADWHNRTEMENVQVVRVKCPSTGRIYFLRVPPEMDTAYQAVAWSFGYSGEDSYQPKQQT